MSSMFANNESSVTYSDTHCYYKYDLRENITQTLSIIEFLLFTDFEQFVHRVVFPIILIGGFVTNSAFLFVVFRIPPMRTVVNQYLTHIAIADVIFLFSVIGKKIVWTNSTIIRVDQGRCWGLFFELITHVLMYATIFASVLIMTLVGFERFYAVCRPMRMYAATTNQRKVSLLLFIVWIICIFLAITTAPVVAQPHTFCVEWPTAYAHLPSELTVFYPLSTAAHVYTCLVQTVPFFIVMVINSVLYVKMVVTMTGRLGTMQTHDLDVGTNTGIRNRVAVMLIINGVAFFVLTFPFQFGSFLSAVSAMTNSKVFPAIEEHRTVQLIFQLLLYTNSVINPIIYNIANSRYRASFKTAFGLDSRLCEDLCLWQRVPAGMHNPRNGGESLRRQTITTTYSSSCVVGNGEILLESDTKC